MIVVRKIRRALISKQVSTCHASKIFYESFHANLSSAKLISGCTIVWSSSVLENSGYGVASTFRFWYYTVAKIQINSSNCVFRGTVIVEISCDTLYSSGTHESFRWLPTNWHKPRYIFIFLKVFVYFEMLKIKRMIYMELKEKRGSCRSSIVTLRLIYSSFETKFASAKQSYREITKFILKNPRRHKRATLSATAEWYKTVDVQNGFLRIIASVV